LRQPGCGSHLSTTFEIILSAHIDHLNDSTTELPRSRVIFKAPEKLYRTSGSQYSFAFARKFLESRFGDQEDVEAWVNQVQAQYRELKLHKFDLDALCIMSCSTVCPIAAARFLHSIWTAEKNPSIEDIKNSILWVNAGQLNRSKEKALAAHTASLSLDSTTSLNAFYTGLEKSGKMPSKAHPCARCGSPTHWVVDCTKPADANENSNNNNKKKGKGEQTNETAAPAQAIKTTESAAFVSDVVTSSHSNSIEHVFLTSDYSHLSLVARSKRWIIDSGASEHMSLCSSTSRRPPPPLGQAGHHPARCRSLRGLPRPTDRLDATLISLPIKMGGLGILSYKMVAPHAYTAASRKRMKAHTQPDHLEALRENAMTSAFGAKVVGVGRWQGRQWWPGYCRRARHPGTLCINASPAISKSGTSDETVTLPIVSQIMTVQAAIMCHLWR
jgi:hypothetical protein